jgi:hypothetical protein
MSAAPLFYAFEEIGLFQSTVKNTRCLLNMAKTLMIQAQGWQLW